jgi:hypothetical protein
VSVNVFVGKEVGEGSGVRLGGIGVRVAVLVTGRTAAATVGTVVGV